MVRPEGPQMTIQQLRRVFFACWLTALFNFFKRQQLMWPLTYFIPYKNKLLQPMLNIFQIFCNNSLFDRKFNKDHQYWSQLRMLKPNFVKINPAAFKMRCVLIRAKGNINLIYTACRLCIQITHNTNNLNSHFNKSVTKTLQTSVG